VSSYQSWASVRDSTEDGLLLVDFELAQHWLAASQSTPPPALPLTALYCVSGGQLQVAVTDQQLGAADGEPVAQFHAWVEQYQMASTVVGSPLALHPVGIGKPWGQEIWYTGVEQRGVCQFASASGRTPIPWLQAVLPGAVAGRAGLPLILLKILDPSAQAVTGDLYFELHEEKREVYVVTHVDKTAWPDGVGCIRYGFDLDETAPALPDREFRARYLAAVEAYEQVRRALDALSADASPDTGLLARERQLRADMDSFTRLYPLRVGDVVVVPPLLPHALQHGVRVIEFQTPVYERRILSFAQQVQTQDHWDTRVAVDQMILAPPAAEPFACLLREPGLLVERIAEFPEFDISRIHLDGGPPLALEPITEYALVMVIEGELLLDGALYGPEQALLLPRDWQGQLGPARPAQPLVLLLAKPCR